MANEQEVLISPNQQKANPFIGLVVNIFLPVAILNKLPKYIPENGPFIALLVALAFPVIYGIYQYVHRHEKNHLSLLGVFSILFTGGLALLDLGGFWFAIKEAAFPLILGIVVLFSAFTQQPMMKTMFVDSGALNLTAIHERLLTLGRMDAFAKTLRQGTYLLSFSFLISSILNYVLARRIFVMIDPQLSAEARSSILNQQIADMTWQGFIVIALPLVLFSGGIVWWFLTRLSRLCGLPLNDLLAAEKAK